jgi:hypothetical protein
MKILFSLLLLISSFSCVTRYKGDRPYEKLVKSRSTEVEGITFFTVKLSQKDATDKAFFEFGGIVRVTGELKENDPFPRTEHSNYLIQLLDGKGRPLKDFYLEDLLNTSGELFHENGEIEHIELSFQEREVVFRFKTISERIEKFIVFELDSAGKEHFIQVVECNY